MRRFSVLTVLLAAGVLTIAPVGEASAQTHVPPPPEGWQACDGCSVSADWGAQGTPAKPENGDCNYDTCGLGGQLGVYTATDLEINTTTGVVTVTLGNRRTITREKHVFIRVEGDGGNFPNPPLNADLKGISPGFPDSNVQSVGAIGYSVDAGGHWFVVIEAIITPQPDQVVLTFDVPGTPVLTEAWASECCNPPPIPTVSEWGLIVLTLLLLTGGAMVLRRRRAAAA